MKLISDDHQKGMIKHVQFKQFIHAKVSEIQAKSRERNISLRFIATKVGIPAGRLSELLNGDRPLSFFYAEKIAEGLSLSGKERDLLFSFVATKTRRKALARTLKSADAARVLVWESLAVLGLLQTNKFTSSPEWIAERLGISISAVKETLEILTDMNLISLRDGEYIRSYERLNIGSEILSEPLGVSLYGDLLVEIMKDLSDSAREKVNSSCMTVAVNPLKVPEAQKLIAKFQRDLISVLESENKGEPYILGIQLSPLVKDL